MIPVLGLGTWTLGGSECRYVVKRALELGYRHIDTAEMYGNHRAIGEAMKGFDRSKIFLTSKVWSNHLHYDDLLRACDRALQELGISYLDLYLIHHPNPRVPLKETFKALEELVASGRVRSVGVSNFDVSLVKESFEVSRTSVTVDEVKFNPQSWDRKLLEFCNDNRIVVTAYSPLGRGSLVRDRTVMDVASKYGKTSAQICLRWCLQKGTVVIPEARSDEHLRENIEIFDWEVSEEDMRRMDSLSED
jgi:diketogulonate reductase-like aldo/keto reductase